MRYRPSELALLHNVTRLGEKQTRLLGDIVHDITQWLLVNNTCLVEDAPTPFRCFLLYGLGSYIRKDYIHFSYLPDVVFLLRIALRFRLNSVITALATILHSNVPSSMNFPPGVSHGNCANAKLSCLDFTSRDARHAFIIEVTKQRAFSLDNDNPLPLLDIFGELDGFKALYYLVLESNGSTVVDALFVMNVLHLLKTRLSASFHASFFPSLMKCALRYFLSLSTNIVATLPIYELRMVLEHVYIPDAWPSFEDLLRFATVLVGLSGMYSELGLGLVLDKLGDMFRDTDLSIVFLWVRNNDIPSKVLTGPVNNNTRYRATTVFRILLSQENLEYSDISLLYNMDTRISGGVITHLIPEMSICNLKDLICLLLKPSVPGHFDIALIESALIRLYESVDLDNWTIQEYRSLVKDILNSYLHGISRLTSHSRRTMLSQAFLRLSRDVSIAPLLPDFIEESLLLMKANYNPIIFQEILVSLFSYVSPKAVLSESLSIFETKHSIVSYCLRCMRSPRDSVEIPKDLVVSNLVFLQQFLYNSFVVLSLSQLLLLWEMFSTHNSATKSLSVCWDWFKFTILPARFASRHDLETLFVYILNSPTFIDNVTLPSFKVTVEIFKLWAHTNQCIVVSCATFQVLSLELLEPVISFLWTIALDCSELRVVSEAINLLHHIHTSLYGNISRYAGRIYSQYVLKWIGLLDPTDGVDRTSHIAQAISTLLKAFPIPSRTYDIWDETNAPARRLLQQFCASPSFALFECMCLIPPMYSRLDSCAGDEVDSILNFQGTSLSLTGMYDIYLIRGRLASVSANDPFVKLLIDNEVAQSLCEFLNDTSNCGVYEPSYTSGCTYNHIFDILHRLFVLDPQRFSHLASKRLANCILRFLSYSLREDGEVGNILLEPVVLLLDCLLSDKDLGNFAINCPLWTNFPYYRLVGRLKVSPMESSEYLVVFSRRGLSCIILNQTLDILSSDQVPSSNDLSRIGTMLTTEYASPSFSSTCLKLLAGILSRVHANQVSNAQVYRILENALILTSKTSPGVEIPGLKETVYSRVLGLNPRISTYPLVVRKGSNAWKLALKLLNVLCGSQHTTECEFLNDFVSACNNPRVVNAITPNSVVARPAYELSVIHQLFMVDIFRKSILEHLPVAEQHSVYVLQSIFRNLMESFQGSVCDIPSLNWSTSINNVHDFVNSILKYIAKTVALDIVVPPIELQLEYTTVSTDCIHRAKKTDSFLTLDLPIQIDHNSLDNSLATLFQESTMSWFCTYCLKSVAARRRVMIVTAPKTLIINLRRECNSFEPISKCSFPMTLNLDNFTSHLSESFSNYKLVGVVRQSKDSDRDDNFMSLAYDRNNGSWTRYDGSIITCTEPDTIITDSCFGDVSVLSSTLRDQVYRCQKGAYSYASTLVYELVSTPCPLSHKKIYPSPEPSVHPGGLELLSSYIDLDYTDFINQLLQSSPDASSSKFEVILSRWMVLSHTFDSYRFRACSKDIVEILTNSVFYSTTLLSKFNGDSSWTNSFLFTFMIPHVRSTFVEFVIAALTCLVRSKSICERAVSILETTGNTLSIILSESQHYGSRECEQFCLLLYGICRLDEDARRALIQPRNLTILLERLSQWRCPGFANTVGKLVCSCSFTSGVFSPYSTSRELLPPEAGTKQHLDVFLLLSSKSLTPTQCSWIESIMAGSHDDLDALRHMLCHISWGSDNFRSFVQHVLYRVRKYRDGNLPTELISHYFFLLSALLKIRDEYHTLRVQYIVPFVIELLTEESVKSFLWKNNAVSSSLLAYISHWFVSIEGVSFIFKSQCDWSKLSRSFALTRELE